MSEQRHFLQDWADEIVAELGLNNEAALTPDFTELLDVTRLVAHNVTRPGGPLATYYIGLAAGLAAGSNAVAGDAAAKITKLVEAKIAATPAPEEN